MKFRTSSGLRIQSNTILPGRYEKPVTCPYCGAFIEPQPINHAKLPYDAGRIALLVSFGCPACLKRFIGSYVLNSDDAEYICIIPIANEERLPECFGLISERFVSIHQQAFRAEARDDMQLAIVGYRTALEILLKDYAIKLLHESDAEVRNKGLRKTIEDYTPQDVTTAADVVRIIGDDYTHYVNGHPEIAFEEFKSYYSMVLSYIEYRYKLINPPVSR